MQTIVQHDNDFSGIVQRCDEGFVNAMLASNSTCAVIDDAGVIAGASPSFGAIFPGALGMPIGACLDFDIPTHTAGGNVPATAFGVFERFGERVPALIQLFPAVQGDKPGTLVLITDGSEFRKAETARFELTPCPVLRVSLEGEVTYANREAYSAFAPWSAQIVGHPLSALFRAAHRPKIEVKIRRCIRLRDAASLDVSTVSLGRQGRRRVKLVFTPDVGPGGKLLGVLVVVESAVQTIRDEIRRIALTPEPVKPEPVKPEPPEETPPYWQTQLDKIFEQIRKLIDFDHANFGVYTNNVTLFRAVSFYPEETKKELKWPARYLDLPAFIPGWLKSGKTWVPNIEVFIARSPELLKSEVVSLYREFGIVSSVTLPVLAAGDATSALSLCSKQVNKYGKRDLDILRDLDLEPILLRCEEKQRAEREEFAASLKAILDAPGPLRTASQKIIRKIRKHFAWDYAAFFRVNRHRGVFELFDQDASEPELAMPRGYLQRIDKGMLASTLEWDCVRTNHHIGAPGVEQYGYIGDDRGLKSAMTIPIHLNKRIRWVLDVECATSHAFRGPDEAALKAVVRSLEEGITRRMLQEMKDCLLKEADRGVVLVGTEGAILELNKTAAELMNCSQFPEGERDYLYDHAEDEDSRAVLKGEARTDKQHVKLKTTREDGRHVTVLATRVDLDSSFDTALWFLNDIEGIQWRQDISFLHETVSDVAQQTRAPLTLASLLAREIPEIYGGTGRKTGQPSAKSVKVHGIVSRLVAEIGKADITFERLAEALSIREMPKRVERRFDLRGCLTDVYGCLPERDRANIDLRLPNASVYLKGDRGRLSFVVRSILAHLVRLQSDESVRIVVALTNDDENATLLLNLPTPPIERHEEQTDDTDELLDTSRAAREAASLSLDAINRIVAAHNGRLETTYDGVAEADGSSAPTAFALSFPKA